MSTLIKEQYNFSKPKQAHCIFSIENIQCACLGLLCTLQVTCNIANLLMRNHHGSGGTFKAASLPNHPDET